MGKDGSRDDIIELGGSEFRRVKNGLDEAQVASFINELISQRDTLIQHKEHLASLNKLAEKTVTEADKLAEEIKAEAKEKAKTESVAIIAKAEEQARQVAEEKRTKIINAANEQVAAIKAKAEREAELLLENERKKIQHELNNFLHQLCSQLLSELESFKQRMVSFEVEFEHKLFQPVEESSTVTTKEDKGHDKFLELIQTMEQKDTDEPDWELEILPPIDIMKIMEFVTRLDNLPEVERTEIIPQTDRPSIMVFLREPVDLIDIMRALPEVVQVNEDSIGTAGANGKPKKVQIALSGKTILDKTKERLESEVSDILSDSF